jgi:hypothetical protein
VTACGYVKRVKKKEAANRLVLDTRRLHACVDSLEVLSHVQREVVRNGGNDSSRKIRGTAGEARD